MESMMHCKKKLVLIVLIMLAAMLTLAGCEKKRPEPETVVEKAEEETPKFEFDGEEVFGDPEIFSTPRLQFAWRAPGFKSKEIWSMRLDGSDLRRVVKAELLYAEQARSVDPDPVRSPDNRYIVISQSTARSIEKHLIDLKTQTKTIIMSGGYKPHFAWRPDSKRVVFVSDPGVMEYNVETKELKTLKPFRSYGHYILDDGRFVVVREKGIDYYTPDQEFIRSVDIFTPEEIKSQNEMMGFYHRVSRDGKFMVYRLKNRTRFLRLDDPKNSIWTTKERYASGGFGPEGKYFYNSVFRLQVSTGKEVRLLEWPCIDHDCAGSVSFATVYNLRSVR